MAWCKTKFLGIISLFRVKTVNLVDLSIGFKSKAKVESSEGLLPHRLPSRLERIRDRKPIVVKKHGRKAKSIFRYGFDYLRSIFLNLDESNADFVQSLQFLSCT